MKNKIPAKLRHAFIRSSLLPVVRFCLRQAIKLQDLQQVLKEALVSEAIKILEQDKIEISASKIALITGVHRKDISLIQGGGLQEPLQADLITKVLGQWQVDREFSRAGRPLPLTCVGKESQFVNLVRKVNREINPYTVLFEMERAGLIKKEDSTVIAHAKEFVPIGDSERLFSMYESDGSDLLAAIEENALSKNEKHFHLRTSFDNIPLEHVAELRKWIFTEGEKFHKRARDKFARYDRDTSKTPSADSATAEMSVTLFEYSAELKKQ